MADEVASGWARPDTRARKYHYFDMDARHSLCGRVSGWAVWLVFVALPTTAEQCQWCQRKLVERTSHVER